MTKNKKIKAQVLDWDLFNVEIDEDNCPIYNIIKCCGECDINHQDDNMICLFSNNPTIEEWEEFNKIRKEV